MYIVRHQGRMLFTVQTLLTEMALLPFQSQISMDPSAYSEKRTRPTLEQRLESIISGAAQLADSISTRDDTRDKIIASCNGVRQALQDLLSEYMNHVSENIIRIVLHF